ncbi:hypothetical protein O3P69_013236 [Scylla paramamosain]|uniref:Uncharacterized protein n=1 Tax=Scylla paramamosain TaxID=85552 RepID=A0AAW0U3V8_SCYPA
MSWPSAYGYKYTPIGLRQREKKDDASGTRSICTTVHLPQGGHLLDIERQYGLDGSMSKRETQNMDPASFVPSPARPATAEPAASNPLLDAFEPRAPTDFERQADDIIANFRARQGLPLEKLLSERHAASVHQGTPAAFTQPQAGHNHAAVTCQAASLWHSVLSATTTSAIKEESSLTSSSSRVGAEAHWLAQNTAPHGPRFL